MIGAILAYCYKYYLWELERGKTELTAQIFNESLEYYIKTLAFWQEFQRAVLER